MAVFILVGLLALLLCTVLVWLRFGWPRWILVALAIGGPLLDANAVATLHEEKGFISVLLALLSRDWEYWLLIASAALLFAPSSNRWFKEKQDDAN
jgi:hypothetical protein